MATAEVGRLRIELEAATARFDQAMDRTNQRMGRIEKSARGMETGFRQAGRALVGFLSIRGLQSFVANMTRLGDEIAKTSRRLGLTVEEYSSLEFAAKRAGIEQNTLALAVQRFGRRVGEASTDGGELRKTLAALKIEIQDGNGGLKSNAELLSEFARRVIEVENPLQRLTLVQKAFDSEGVVMVELLPELARGFDAVKREAAAAGVLIEDSTARSLERANEAIKETELRLRNLSLTGAGFVLNLLNPDLDTRIERTTEKIQKLQREIVNLNTGPLGPHSQIPIRTPVLTDAAGRPLGARPGFATLVRPQLPPGVPSDEDLARARQLEEELLYQQSLLKVLAKEKQAANREDERALVSAEELAERYRKLVELGSERAARSGGRGGVGTVFRLDYRDPLGPVGFAKPRQELQQFNQELTDSQQLIVSGTQSAMSSFTSEISQALTQGEFRFEQFAANVAASLAQITIQQIILSTVLKPLFGAIGIPGFGGGEAAAVASAHGNVFSRGRVVPFARGGLVTKPTVFPMANGGIGLAGEAGTEAILPLTRTPSGDLGVKASGGAGVFAPSITINYTAAAGGEGAGEATRTMAAGMKRQLDEWWRSRVYAESRTGGVLRPLG